MFTQKKSNLRTNRKWLLYLVLAICLIPSSLYLWAYLSTGYSLVARGIMWGDSDAGDLYRFPTRMILSSSSPLQFAPPDGQLEKSIAEIPITNDEIGVSNMPLDEYLGYTNTNAFIILHGDHLLYEAYFNGAVRETALMSFSASKSFASTLTGIAIEEGFINDLDDPITDYLPELVEQDPRFDEISLRHLVMMTSGLRWDRSESNPFSDDFITYYSPDLRAVALASEIVEPPGQNFLYNDYNPLLLGMILERATGMSVSQYMESRLWQPMGAEGDGFWSLDSESAGFEKMFAGLNGRAIDLAKLGWLFLKDGKNGDTQVVPASWIEEVSSIQAKTDSRYTYQHYWWIDNDRKMFFAEGDKCQFIFVYPRADLVIARFGTDCGGTGFSDLIPNIAMWVENQLAGR